VKLHKIKANNVTYTLILQSCAMLKLLDRGKEIHEDLKRLVPTYMKYKELYNQLLDMYIKCGEFTLAEEIFVQIKEPNVINYGSMMKFYNSKQQYEKTLKFYDQLKLQPKNTTGCDYICSCFTSMW